MSFENRTENPTPAEGVIAGRNPVIELLKSDAPVDKIFMQKTNDQEREGSLLKIKAMAAERGVPVKETTRERLDSLCGGINHQGVAAFGAVCDFVDIDRLFEIAKERNEPLFAILCDDIEDPHNLGAIIRSANAAGAHGVIVPKRHGVGLTPAVAKASAGAVQYTAVARVANLASAIEVLKERGAWVYCADMDGQDWCGVDYAGAVVIVVGSEGNGVSRLIKEKSDFVVRVPMLGEVSSLNASVAGGILMYEVARQRQGIKSKN